MRGKSALLGAGLSDRLLNDSVRQRGRYFRLSSARIRGGDL